MTLTTPRAAASAVALALLAVPALAFALVTGTCRGTWDLPGTASIGSANGVLVDASGQQAFQMDVQLQATPNPGLFDAGTFFGSLDDGSGAAFPQYGVSGTYVGSTLAQSGLFRGVITRQVSPKGPIAIIGRIKGQYADPEVFPSNGTFTGQWTANL